MAAVTCCVARSVSLRSRLAFRRSGVWMGPSSGERPLYKTGRAKAVFDGVGSPAPSVLGASALSGLPDVSRPFVVLGIETSCDDTAAAVVRSDGAILGEAVVSQHEIHAEFGGIVPGLARDAHETAIDEVVGLALERSGLGSVADVDAVAATVGPGLEICLRVGARKAVGLARAFRKPFVAAHHLEAHCLVSRLPGGDGDAPPAFPFLALLASGGHCQLLWIRGVGDISVLGGTLDDALGEAYDKAARMLDLAAPTGGGPAVEAAAARGDPESVALPVPMRQRKDCDLSYAGLKNALRMRIAERKEALGLGPDDAVPPDAAADLAASFQHVAITHVEDRLKVAFKAVAREEDLDAGAAAATPTLALVGGVAANKELRSRVAALCDDHGWTVAVPQPRLCTDNGAMVAWAAIEKLNLGFSDALDDEVLARWPFREWARPSAAPTASPAEPPKKLKLATSPAAPPSSRPASAATLSR